ncbi:MAG: ABC transporter substrate-binding protein, partial [Oscillospiraceae bacterium]
MRKVHFSPLLALALALSLSACATPSQTPSLAGSTAAPMAPSIFSSAPLSEPSTKSTLRIAGLKGPTTMGLVKLVADAADNKTANQYAFTMYGAADEIVAQLGKGNLDAAAIPANLASVLWNRTNGEIQMAAINTLGILYILESGDTIHSI